MPIFHKDTPEEKAAKEQERQRQMAAEAHELRRKKAAEEAQQRIATERARRERAALDAIEAYYVNAAPKWEYRTEYRKRLWEWPSKDSAWAKGKDWNADDFMSYVNGLGDSGWELVAVVGESSYTGGWQTCGGATSIAADFAGFTSDEAWVFRRPKSSLPAELVTNLSKAQAYDGIE